MLQIVYAIYIDILNKSVTKRSRLKITEGAQNQTMVLCSFDI